MSQPHIIERSRAPQAKKGWVCTCGWKGDDPLAHSAKALIAFVDENYPPEQEKTP